MAECLPQSWVLIQNKKTTDHKETNEERKKEKNNEHEIQSKKKDATTPANVNKIPHDVHWADPFVIISWFQSVMWKLDLISYLSRDIVVFIINACLTILNRIRVN